MKPLQILDALRNIKKQWVSFLSIVLIVMLGVMVYLGINFAANSMKAAGGTFYDETNFKDLEIDATLLMSDIDIEALINAEGVSDAEGVYMTTGYLKAREVQIQTITNRISVPIVLEGRLPEADNECAIEQGLLDKCGLSVGDQITVKNASGNYAKYMKRAKFTITGSVLHPDHVTVKLPENLYVLVNVGAFDTDELDNHFMKAEIKLEDSADVNSFEKAYFKAIQPTLTELSDLAVERSKARDDEIYSEGKAQIDDAVAQLSDGKIQLDDARTLLDEKQKELEDGKKQLADGKKRLEEAEAELAAGEKELKEGKAKLDDAKAQLADGKKELAKGKEQLADGKKQLADAKKKLQDGKAELADGKRKLADAKQQLADGKKQLADGKKKLADAKKQLADGKKQLEESEKQLADGEKQLADAKTELEKAAKEIEENEKKLEDGKKQLDSAKKELDENEKKLREGKQKLDKAKKELDDAKKKLDSAKKQLDAGKKTLEEGKKALSEGKKQLEESYTVIITTKNEVRHEVKALLKASLPPEEYATYKWAADESTTTNVDTNVTVTQSIDLTDKDSIDLTKPLDDNMRTILKNHGASDVEATAIIARSKKEPEYANAQKSLESLSSGISTWNTAHTEYLKSKEAYVNGQKEYESKKAEYDKSKKKYDSGLAEYNEGLETYKTSKAKFDKAKKEYEEGEAKYTKGLNELNDAKKKYKEKTEEYEEGVAKLEKGKKDYEDGKARYEQGLVDYKKGKKEYKAGIKKYNKKLKEYKAGVKKYKAGVKEYKAGVKKYKAGLAKYKAGVEEYKAGLARYKAGLKEYKAGQAKYQKGLEKYNAGKAEYEAGLKKYESSLKKLEEGEKQLEEGERLYKDKYNEYVSGTEELEKGKQKLENLEACKWFTFDRKSNAAYVDLNMVSDNLSSLGMTFSLLFILVGAMVCYATIGRMVDEQRSLVGATKALGLFNKEIFGKYLIFGLSSAAIGVILGTLLAYFGMQKAILYGYANMYVMGEAPKTLIPIITCIVAVFGVVLAAGAVYIATGKLLSSTAISLMKEEMPKSRKKKKAAGGSLYTQMIISNMVTDLRRVAVTIVSVAGCCALLVIGFTLKFSVDGVMDIQFGQIVKYDYNLNYSPAVSGNVEGDIEAVLNEKGCDYYKIYNTFTTYDVAGVIEIGQLMVAEDDGITAFHSLLDVKTGKQQHLTEEGIMIQKRLAETYDLKVGDEFTIYDPNAKEHQVKVSGIFNNYTGRTMIMSHTAYEKTFGTDVRNNRYLIKGNGVSIDDLRAAIKDIKGKRGIGQSDTSRALFASISTILNALIIGLIVMAAMMGLFVLLNLANMYLIQKHREMTVMRINGFTIREVKRYVSLETYVTTALGILLGFGLGGWMSYSIIRSLEQPHIQLIRSVSLPALALAAVITAVMTAVINMIAMRKIKDLSLTDM